MKQEYEIEIRWRAFPLHPDIPEDGLLLEDLFADNITGIREKIVGMQKIAAGLGLAFGEQKMVCSSRLAQELRYWAATKSRADAFDLAVFTAYFAEGENIGKVPVLVRLTASAGLPSHEAKDVLETRPFKDAVDADWDLSREKKIIAAPTFVIGENRLVGAQSYDNIRKFMDKCGVRTKQPFSKRPQ